MTQAATLTNPPASTVALIDDRSAEPLIYGMTPTTWFKVISVSVLMIATFRFNLVRLWLKTNPFTGELNWRHSVCVPIIGLYYLYVNRDDLRRAKTHVAWSGLGILILGVLLFAFAIWPGQNDFLKDFGMVVTLFGVVLLLCGWEVMKIAWFPIVFLVCAIPWPELVYSFIASPLQHLAASVAVGTLRLTGVEAYNSGTKIIMAGKDIGGHPEWHSLNVAEACAGMRSLMTFISVGGAVAFLSMRPMWQKILITLSAIPIAIFCNVMRVSGQGLLDRYVSHRWSQGFAHQFAGIVMLVPGFLLILAVGWFLDQILVEVADDEPRPKRSIVKVQTEPANWSLQRPTPPSASKTQAPTASVAKPASVPSAPAIKPIPASAAQPAVKAAAAKPVTKPAPATKPATAQPANPATPKPPNAALKKPAGPVPPGVPPKAPAPAANIRKDIP